ncbi:MAG: hypothetical protein ACI4DY_10745, partial [Monoglobaceae bacterium]
AAGDRKLYKAALMAAVCKKTTAGYSVVSTRTVCREDIGENDELKVTVSLPDAEQYFIKAVLLETVPSARAVTPIAVFSK